MSATTATLDEYTWVIEALSSGVSVIAAEYFVALASAKRCGDAAALERLKTWWPKYASKWPYRYAVIGSLTWGQEKLSSV